MDLIMPDQHNLIECAICRHMLVVMTGPAGSQMQVLHSIHQEVKQENAPHINPRELAVATSYSKLSKILTYNITST
jgi:hypothetical protein